jgi:small subunit ribosomal protein S17
MPRRILVGVVTRDKADKTRRVEIERIVRHSIYGKFIRRRTVCHMHDEDNVSAIGDTVELEESPPLSKLKRWRLVRVVKKNDASDALVGGAKTVQEEALGSILDSAVKGE